MALLAGVTAMLVGLPVSTPPSGAESMVIIDGRGFGHGVGMAQDGAYWLGRSGRSASQILQTFYPGTTLSRRGGAIRVPLAVASVITVRLSGAGSIGATRIPADTPVSISTREGGFRVTVGGSAPDTEIAVESTDTASATGTGAGPTGGSGSTGASPGSGSTGEPAPAPTPEPVPVPVPVPVPAPAAPVAVGAPASPGFVAAVSPVRVAAASVRLFRGLRAQGDAALPGPVQGGVQGVQAGATVPVVAVPPPPAVVVTPVDPTPSTVGDPNSVVVAEVPAASTPPGPVPVADPAPPVQGPPMPAGDATGANPASPSAESTPRVAGARPSSFEIDGTRVEITSSGLIGMGGRRFRGSLELSNRGGSVRVVNIVDVEQYLRGMGEILYRDWPAATLQAQAVAARTYAIRMMGTVGEVCPTQACQVYLGAQVEYSQMDAAVAATRGQVVTYRGSLANTFYSASGGGTIADPSEGFGGDISVPYLQAGVYPTGDLKAWTVSMSLGEVARRVGYGGTPTGIAITEVGPSGRAKEVTVYGSSGPLRVGGPRFDAALGLRSTFFTFRGSAVGMSPLPDGVGAANAAEVVAAGPSDGSSGQGGSELAPTLSQSPFLFGATTDSTPDVASGSEVAVTETVPSEMPTAPLSAADASTAASARADDPRTVSVIDNDASKKVQGPLLVLGAAVALLLGAGVIRRLVGAKRRRH